MQVFTESTHIVAVRTTGNVFCFEVGASPPPFALGFASDEVRTRLAAGSAVITVHSWNGDYRCCASAVLCAVAATLSTHNADCCTQNLKLEAISETSNFIVMCEVYSVCVVDC